MTWWLGRNPIGARGRGSGEHRGDDLDAHTAPPARRGPGCLMRTLEETPTRPAHYAVLTAAFAAAAGAAGRLARGSRDPIRQAELLPIGLATFSVARTVTHDKVESWARSPFVAEPPDGQRAPRGRGMRYAIGELMTCSRCAGTWAALSLVLLRLRAPDTGRAVVAIGCASAVNDIAQALFSQATAAANRASAGAERADLLRDRAAA
jgi:hypothetical protein